MIEFILVNPNLKCGLVSTQPSALQTAQDLLEQHQFEKLAELSEQVEMYLPGGVCSLNSSTIKLIEQAYRLQVERREAKKDGMNSKAVALLRVIDKTESDLADLIAQVTRKAALRVNKKTSSTRDEIHALEADTERMSQHE